MPVVGAVRFTSNRCEEELKAVAVVRNVSYL
jgi:hypothetical protein